MGATPPVFFWGAAGAGVESVAAISKQCLYGYCCLLSGKDNTGRPVMITVQGRGESKASAVKSIIMTKLSSCPASLVSADLTPYTRLFSAKEVDQASCLADAKSMQTRLCRSRQISKSL